MPAPDNRSRRSRRPKRIVTLIAAAALLVAACGDDDQDEGQATPSTASDAFPVTVDNCGDDLVLDVPPTDVMLIGSNPLGLVEAVDGLDQVTSRTGQLTGDHWSDETRALVETIEPLTLETGATGGVEITREAVAEADPDLVIGYETDTLTRAGLAEVGIPLYILPAFCPNPPPTVSFDTVYDQIEVFGTMFGSSDAAATTIDGLRARVEAVEVPESDLADGAFLYAPTQGGALYAYGPASMAHPQLEALGLDNVYGEGSERYFEINAESLVERDPDVIVVLYSEDSDPETARAVVEAFPGAAAVDAVAEGRIITQPFELTDPPNPYSVLGLENLVDQLAEVAGTAAG